MKFDKPPEGASNSSRKIAPLFTVESTYQALQYVHNFLKNESVDDLENIFFTDYYVFIFTCII